MGHTAIAILMAALSCCVWKNVEVRPTHDVSHLKGWRSAISTRSMSAGRRATTSPRFHLVTSTSHDRLTPCPASPTRAFTWARFHFQMHPVSARVMSRKCKRQWEENHPRCKCCLDACRGPRARARGPETERRAAFSL